MIPSSSAAQTSVEPGTADVALIRQGRRIELPCQRQADSRRAGVPVAHGGPVDKPHQRRTRPMRRLDRTWSKDAVGEQGGMRVGEHSANGRAVGQRGKAARLWKRPDRSDDARQSRKRDVEDREKLLVPRRPNHVKELRARGVAGLDDGFAAEARQQKRVNGADADFARFRPRLAVRQRVQKPARLRRGKHGVERQTTLAADKRRP